MILQSMALVAVATYSFEAWGQDGAQAGPSATSWKTVASPNGARCPMVYPLCLSKAQGNILFATSTLSPTDVWAVGAEPNTSSVLTSTLAEHWDGSKWSVSPTPKIAQPMAQLDAVTAISSTDVWAAGYAQNPSCVCAQAIIEQWNGTSWTQVPSPNPGISDTLYGIAAVSASDIWAVGVESLSESSFVPLILHYDGTSWSALNESQFATGELFTVLAVASNDVWAMGTIGGPGSSEALALHWDGTSWTQISFPAVTPGYLEIMSTSGTGSDDVWAVGTHIYYDGSDQYTSDAVAFHWNGTQWALSKEFVSEGGTTSYLAGVHAIATNDVWAVGQWVSPSVQVPDGPYVTLHWNGSQWSTVGNPQTGVLYGVSASSASNMWVVGYGLNPKNDYSTGTYTMTLR